MFDLRATDQRRRILGCGDGPAGFNSELTRRGGDITSVDPLYAFDTEQIRNRIADAYVMLMGQVNQNRGHYVWDSIASAEELGHVRMSAMEMFLADFDAGKREGRYIAGELPFLPFESGKYDIALSSHFLFSYSAQLSAAFHVHSLEEMLRVSREVRVFPLLTFYGASSPHLPFVTDQLANQGLRVTIERVSYEFQRGGDEMLVVKAG